MSIKLLIKEEGLAFFAGKLGSRFDKLTLIWLIVS